MRIIILGDFHLSSSQPQIADEAMEDVNRLHPDLIVPLGDFGAGAIGSPAGLEEAWAHLRKLDAPLRPILGNHDLQEESAGKREHYSMIKALHEICGGEAGGGFVEFDDFRLMFASTDPQPADSCWTVQECYVAPEQFGNLMEAFKKRPGVPIIAFTHAPPIGCGLRTVPTVHVRCTNAYLDQNHDVYRWEKLYRENAEFVMWFSAHYHLGHDHHNSMTDVCGTRFFQTQIHGLQTRDNTRASRVLDITPESITVSTLDHIARQLTTKSQWHFEGSLSQLTDSKKQKIANGCRPEPQFTLSAEPLPGCLQALSADRFLAGTADGFLWEVEPSTRSVLGTLHIGSPLSGVVVADELIWRSWENKIVSVPRNDLSRFMRVAKPESFPGCLYEIDEPVIALTKTIDGVAALGKDHLWIYSPAKDCFESMPCVTNN
jgi:hypothetical protein